MADNKTSIVITAEDRASATLRQVQSSLGSMSTSISRLLPSFASLGGAMSLAGAANFVRNAIDANAALDDMAEKTGATVESLSALSDIAKIGGHEMGTVESAMIRLTKALAGGDDEAKAAGHALEALGLKAEDLRKMDTGTAMLEIAKALDKFGDSGGKSALVMDLLGKSGAQALPFLKDLAETGELNAKVTAEQAAQAEKLQKSWNQLRVYADDLGRSLATAVVPGLERMAQAFSGGIIEGAVSRWGAAFKGLAAGLSELNATSSEFLGKITFGSVSENHYKQAIRYRDAAKAIYAEMSKLAPVGAVPAAAKQALDYTSVAAGSKGGKGDKTKVQEQIDALGSGSYLTRDKATATAIKESFDFENWAWGELAKDRETAAKEAEKYDASLRKAAQSLYDATDAGRFDRLNRSIAEAKDAFAAGYLSEDQLGAIEENLTRVEDKLKNTKSIGEELGLTFTSAFEDAIVGGKKFSEVLQAIAQDILRMVTRKNITEPLANAIGSFDWSKLLPSANGNVFTSPGLSAYSGQVVSRPTVFPFASGIGLMGEAGPEAILPLKRGSNGKLGVEGGGGGMVVNIIEQPGSGGKTAQRQQGNTRILDVFVEQIKASIATDISDGRGAIPGALSNSYGLNRAAGAY